MTWRPVGALLIVAPFLGEVLSTATAPLDLLLPWNLALFAALYGGGALLCRETACRWRLGVPGLFLLGGAYGVFEEAVVDRFWFDPAYAEATGVGDYGRVGETSVLLAAHLTAFHATVSVCCSVLIVTWLFPHDRDRPWVRPRGLIVVAAAMLLVLFLTWEEFVPPPPGPTTAAVATGVLLVLAARWSRRWAGHPSTRAGHTRAEPPTTRSRPRLAALVAFASTAAHFVLTYTVPSSGLPWPVGVIPVLLPLVAGALALRRRALAGAGTFPVVAGIIGFFALLTTLIGLTGRYDRTAAGVLTIAGLVWLRRRARPLTADPPSTRPERGKELTPPPGTLTAQRGGGGAAVE